MHRGMTRLPVLGVNIHNLLFDLTTYSQYDSAERVYQKKIDLIETACQQVIQELVKEGLSDSTSSFLLDHRPVIQSLIQDLGIKSLNVWIE
jgi:hypothetical protein